MKGKAFQALLALVLLLILVGMIVGASWLYLNYMDAVINSDLPGWLKVILT